MLRELAKEHVGDDESEDRVAEELERLVVEDAAAGVLVHARAMRQRVLEQAVIAELVADDPLERLELSTDAGHASVRAVVTVAVDESCRFVGVLLVHRHTEFVDRDGKRGREMSAEIMAGMPCDSRRPRTTSASIWDGVRKMTFRSPISDRAHSPAFVNDAPTHHRQGGRVEDRAARS